MIPATHYPQSLELSAIRAEVSLDALRHNVRVLRGYAGDAQLMAAIKADAYGHGAGPISLTLQDEGVQHFAVATVQEGIELREAGIEQAVYVLGAPIPEMLPAYVRHRLVATISSVEVADAVMATAAQTGPLVIHMKVDTGMRRLGVTPDEVPDVLRRLRAAPGVSAEGIWTHFATVDRSFTLEQLARFNSLLGSLDDPPPVTHVANSGTLLYLPETARGRSMVRTGGALYGMEVYKLPGFEDVDLRPVMRLVSRVVHLRDVQPSDTVSYGRTWTAERPTRIATVAAGYGDGFLRAFSNRGSVGIAGKLCPIVGRVCMDMFMVDIGPPEDSWKVELGDEVVLFGPGGLSAVEMAETVETIAYELTCGLTKRVPRIYSGEQQSS